jgi:predicted nucleic acid-binding protein
VSITYLDTSALIKRYVAEVGSEWIRDLLVCSGAPTACTSHLTVVEAACAFARRRREGFLSPEDHAETLRAFDHDFAYAYNILDVTTEVLDAARSLANEYPLRAYDAVHLATAWLANRELVQAGQPPLIFICADDRLLDVAVAVGLMTENPNRYP